MNRVETSSRTSRFGILMAVDGLKRTVPAGRIYALIAPKEPDNTTGVRVPTTLLRQISLQAKVAAFDGQSGAMHRILSGVPAIEISERPREELPLKKDMRKPCRWAIATLAALAPAFYAGCGQRAASAPPPPAPIVEVVPVVQKDTPIYGEWVGTLEGYLNAHISPQVSGYLIRQDYHEGSLVRKDQVLFEIDPRPFQAMLDQAKAQLAEGKAQLAKATLDVNRDIPEAQAHAIPQSQLDNDRQEQLAAKAAVEAGEAAVEQASLNLGYTRVRSLIPGIAGITMVQVGNLVGPSTVLTSVSELNPIKVYFPVNEQEYLRIAGRIAPGTVNLLSHSSPIPLQMILSNGNTYPYRGRILFAGREVDPATGTIRIVGKFPNPGNVLRPGQYARVRALTQMLKGALLVPQQAVTQLQGSYQVAVVGADNRVQIRAVQVGPTVGTNWVITSGLQPNERVVAEGAQKLRDGERVTPKPFALTGAH